MYIHTGRKIIYMHIEDVWRIAKYALINWRKYKEETGVCFWPYEVKDGKGKDIREIRSL